MCVLQSNQINRSINHSESSIAAPRSCSVAIVWCSIVPLLVLSSMWYYHYTMVCSNAVFHVLIDSFIQSEWADDSSLIDESLCNFLIVCLLTQCTVAFQSKLVVGSKLRFPRMFDVGRDNCSYNGFISKFTRWDSFSPAREEDTLTTSSQWYEEKTFTSDDGMY